jgi:hypothetical protein
MVEKWTRLAEVQSKLNAAPSGLVTTCANAAAVEGATGMEGYLDIALKEAENTRRGLAEENTHLRELVLRAVNDLQATVSMVKSMASPSSPLSTGQEVEFCFCKACWLVDPHLSTRKLPFSHSDLRIFLTHWTPSPLSCRP